MKSQDFYHLMSPRAASLFAKAVGRARLPDPMKIAELFVSDPEGTVFSYPDLVGVLPYMRGSLREALRDVPVPYVVKASDLEAGSIQQMEAACKLPIAVAGALMPDAHQGYGLPIGGVLATDNAVIPYGVGVDIGCSMRLTIFDAPASEIERNYPRLCQVLEQETGFGAKGQLDARVDHDVLEDPRWQATRLLRGLHDRARKQLGTSGSGNHFVEFGTVEYEGRSLLALLSHSGSRGAGAAVAEHYTKIATEGRPDMGKLAWLGLDTAEGREYWDAMELMGDYARACHETIHRVLAKATGYKAHYDAFNAHNLAWRESHGSRDVIVHRKGATPAFPGQVGIIPGSMATPAYLVKGLGDEASLCSASHGAGRRMSRTESLQQYDARAVKALMEASQVTLLSGGKDENPFAYKRIEDVMAHQEGTMVSVFGVFRPRIVMMAPEENRKSWKKVKADHRASRGESGTVLE